MSHKKRYAAITKNLTSRHAFFYSGRMLTALLALLAAVALAPFTGLAQATPGKSWVATWGTGMSGAGNDFFFAATAYNGNNVFNDQTVRLVVHASLGGKHVRIRLSNEQGTAALTIAGAHIALSDGAANIVAGTDHLLTFNGGDLNATLPIGAPMVSDAVDMDVPTNANLAVSLYFPGPTTVATAHPNSTQYTYVSPVGSGNVASAASLPLDATVPSILEWPLLSGVEVRVTDARAFVVLGSSVANGTLSTINANHRWPDFLSKRLARRGLPVSVVDASVLANPLLHNFNGDNALARFDRDVLARPGVAYVLINDVIGVELNQHSGGTGSDLVTAEQVIEGLRQYVLRAHSEGIKAYAATILPLEGGTGYSDAFESKRQTINALIRAGTLFDGYADFDAAVRDPADPARILAAYDGGDHHHLNDAGYQLLANTFDLALFQ